MTQDESGSIRPAAVLKAGGSASVFVERHMFRLADPAGPPPTGSPSPTDEHPVSLGAAPDVALFHSAPEDGYTHTDAEHWTAQPPEPYGDWDFSLTRRVAPSGAEVCMASGVSSLGGTAAVAPRAGEYVLGVWCRGRAEARTAYEAWLGQEEE